MNYFCLPEYFIRRTTSFSHQRIAHIELENQLSRPFELKSGTSQDSPISSLIYILFKADSMNSIPYGVDYGLFVDGTAMISWELVIQPSKTELIHFSPHPRKNIRILFIFEYQTL